MQNNGRFILFLTLSMVVLYGWLGFVGPKLFPKDFQKPVKVEEKTEDAKTGKTADVDKTAKTDEKTVKKTGKTSSPQKTSEKKTSAKTPDKKSPVKQPPEVKPEPKKPAPQNPRKTVKLGSLDPESGYFIQATLTSLGASVTSVELNDVRYGTIKNPKTPLKVVGNTDSKLRTFDTKFSFFDDILEGLGHKKLSETHWKTAAPLKDGEGAINDVTFTWETPDGAWVLKKRYWLERLDLSGLELRTAQDTESVGYELRMELSIENRSKDDQSFEYELQGPVGLPLENIENARVFQGIVVGRIEDGGVKAVETTAATLVDNETDQWENPLRYAGVDTQYFTAIVTTSGDEKELRLIKVAEASVVAKPGKEEPAEITIVLKTDEFEVPAGKTVSHQYTLYAGPKRKALLEAYDATDVIKFGFFGPVAKFMLWLMSLFHNILGAPYAIAIILLTAMVRGCMFPLSRKQAKSARKMKQLQPKLAELKKKHGKDREKMARAQMELFSQHGYNPLAGCLPIFLQLPIFIGLYTALNNAVDLRLAAFPFTWIDNLAAPDAFYRMPFRLPFLGQDFNVLPIITSVLFVVQQKMFMPPPAPDDEQAQMTHKMMMFMPIIMGFLFYTVPAGLCVYFIASSAWGIGERKLLDIKADALPEGGDGDGDPPENKDKKADAPKKSGGGFFGKLLAMADQAADARASGNGDSNTESQNRPQGGGNPGGQSRGKKGKGGGKGKRSKR